MNKEEKDARIDEIWQAMKSDEEFMNKVDTILSVVAAKIMTERPLIGPMKGLMIAMVVSIIVLWEILQAQQAVDDAVADNLLKQALE